MSRILRTQSSTLLRYVARPAPARRATFLFARADHMFSAVPPCSRRAAPRRPQVPPTNAVRHTRACLVCRLVKTYEQFHQNGCENCPFLEMAGSSERVSDCTTPHFDGFLCVVEPRESWCAKWQREGTARRRFARACWRLFFPVNLSRC